MGRNGYLLVLIPLRNYAGGYHAKKDWQCILLSVSILLVMILAERTIVEKINTYTFFVLEFVLWLFILKVTPVEHVNRPLSLKEKKHYAVVAGSICSLQIIAAMVCLLAGADNIFYFIVISHIFLAGMLLAGIIENKKCNIESS